MEWNYESIYRMVNTLEERIEEIIKQNDWSEIRDIIHSVSSSNWDGMIVSMIFSSVEELINSKNEEKALKLPNAIRQCCSLQKKELKSQRLRVNESIFKLKAQRTHIF